jgi:hypothetical protein
MGCNNIRDGFIHVNKINQIKHNFTNNFEVDRKKIKDEVVDLFKSEKAGQGKGNLATRVVYCVEQTGNELIYLKRPAPLNKGFDFEVHLNRKVFFKRQKSRPSHDCIINILNNLKKVNINIFNDTQKIIDEIYKCDESKISSIGYTINHISIETLLKIIKWLFIEQDITYWSYSGREMFYQGLKNV